MGDTFQQKLKVGRKMYELRDHSRFKERMQKRAEYFRNHDCKVRVVKLTASKNPKRHIYAVYVLDEL